MQLSEGWCSLIGSLLASLIGSLLFAQLPLLGGTQRCRLFPRVSEGTGQLSALVVPASNLKSTDTLVLSFAHIDLDCVDFVNGPC